MDILPVSFSHAAERVAALWLEMAGVLQAEAAQGDPEAAQVQALALPTAPLQRTLPGAAELASSVAEPARHDDAAAPSLACLPQALLTLKTDPAGVFDPSWRQRRAPAAEAAAEPEPTPALHAEPEVDTQRDATTALPAAVEDGVDAVCLDGPDTEWCRRLTRRIHFLLAGQAVAPALAALADQWRRGRCALLTCPRQSNADLDGWAFVLWPTGGSTPSLFGARLAARLHWLRPPPEPAWRHAVLMREHDRRSGRQLVAGPAARAPVAPPCEVQLGPLAAPRCGGSDLQLQIGDVRRAWAALGRQWTVQLAASPLPLLPFSA